MPAIDNALSFCGYVPQDIKALYVCSGPGSFTGLRIGLATAKGIAFGLNIPLYSFSSLLLGASAAYGLGRKIMCCIDAKMKELYIAYYDEYLQEIIPPRVISPAAMLELAEDGFILCGSGTALVSPLLTEAGRKFYPLPSVGQNPGAAGLFSLAQLWPEKHQARNLEDLEPLYLRESTAQIKKNSQPK